MKKWKEVSPYTGTPVKEDAPTMGVGGGHIAGLGVDHPDRPGSGEPGKKKKKMPLIDGRTKSYKAHRAKLEAQRIRRENSRRRQSSLTSEALEKIDQLEFAMAGYDKVRPMADLNASKNYDLYHKDFSSAMQHAYKMAKKLHGITIDPKEIDSKVATGPRKPGSGKTNKYSLKGDKGTIQIQVYNKGGSKPFELNMYKS